MKRIKIYEIMAEMDNQYKRFFVEGKTKKGAIGNLKNIHWNVVDVVWIKEWA